MRRREGTRTLDARLFGTDSSDGVGGVTLTVLVAPTSSAAKSEASEMAPAGLAVRCHPG